MQPYSRIRLDDLLGRDLTVQWFEGVAVVQEVCRQILAFGSAQSGFPSLAEVFLCAHGEIELVGTASSSQSVAAAGHMLSLMLRQDAPLDLRLVATQAIAGARLPHAAGVLRRRCLLRTSRPGRRLFCAISMIAPRLRSRVATCPRSSFRRPNRSQHPKSRNQTTSEELQPAKKWHRNRLVLAGIAGGILCVAVLGLPRGSKGPAASAVAAVQNVVRSTLAARRAGRTGEEGRREAREQGGAQGAGKTGQSVASRSGSHGMMQKTAPAVASALFLRRRCRHCCPFARCQ